MEPKNSKEVTEIYRKELQAKLGERFKEDTFKKAMGRLKTWCKNAYGSVDLLEHYSESGSAAYYYEEVEEGEFKTSNRKAYQNWRRN
jgi:hypothetical protein